MSASKSASCNVSWLLTTVMVTHDWRGADHGHDRLVVMNVRPIRQVGTQQDLYERPEKFDRIFRRPLDLHRQQHREPQADSSSAGGPSSPARRSGPGGARSRCVERLALLANVPQASDNSLSGRGGIRLLSRFAGRPARRLSPQERVIVQIQNPGGQPLPAQAGRSAGVNRRAACFRRSIVRSHWPQSH